MGHVQLSCPVRQAQLVSILLNNGLENAAALSISYDSPLLHGPDTLLLQAKESRMLEACFAPLTPGEYTSTIVITHPQVSRSAFPNALCP